MISVLFPVYDTPKELLLPSLESCLNQTIGDYEIVIINNESTSAQTIAILQAYAAEYEKINLYNCPRQQNKRNLSIALNYGLRKCKYNLVARMDSDDRMTPDRLEKQLLYMKDNPDVGILGGQILIHPMGNITNHPLIITKEMVFQSEWFINHPTVMFKRDEILNIGGYRDTPVHFAEDYDLWCRAMTNGLQIHNLKEVIVNYTVHANNMTKVFTKHPDFKRVIYENRIEFAKKNDLNDLL